jgi:hypothetical protein
MYIRFRLQALRSLCTGLCNSGLEERPEGNGHFEDLGTDGRIVPKGTGLEDVDWIHRTQDRPQWRSSVNKQRSFVSNKFRDTS